MKLFKVEFNKIIVDCECGKRIWHPRYNNNIVKCTACGIRANIIRNDDFVELEIIMPKRKINSGFELD